MKTTNDIHPNYAAELSKLWGPPLMIREFHLQGEEVKRSMEWLIRRIIKAASRISYHGRRWWVHVASSFPLAHHYRAVLGAG